MKQSEIEVGGVYVGAKGTTRTVVDIGPFDGVDWVEFSPPMGTVREITLRNFARWAVRQQDNTVQDCLNKGVADMLEADKSYDEMTGRRSTPKGEK